MVRSCCAFGPFEYLIRLFSLPPSLMTEGEGPSLHFAARNCYQAHTNPAIITAVLFEVLSE